MQTFSWVLAYNKALEDAIAVLDKIAMSIDLKDRKFSTNLFITNFLNFCIFTWVCQN